MAKLIIKVFVFLIFKLQMSLKIQILISKLTKILEASSLDRIKMTKNWLEFDQKKIHTSKC